jgi:hypothetical protein
VINIKQQKGFSKNMRIEELEESKEQSKAITNVYNSPHVKPPVMSNYNPPVKMNPAEVIED